MTEAVSQLLSGLNIAHEIVDGRVVMTLGALKQATEWAGLRIPDNGWESTRVEPVTQWLGADIWLRDP